MSTRRATRGRVAIEPPPSSSNKENDDTMPLSSEESEAEGGESDQEGSVASGSGTSVSSVHDASGTFRRKYNRLISTCRKLEKREGFSGDIQAVMTKNIQSAKSLFDELSHGGSGPPGVSQGSSQRAGGPSHNLGSAPGDIYMAFLHTKMISDVLKSKTNSIGTSNSGFKLDVFIHALKRKAVKDDAHTYSPQIASQRLAKQYARCSTTLPMLTACIGSFDRDAISVPKQKKSRAPMTKKTFEEIEKTQEDVNSAVQKKGKGPEKITHHLNRILRQHTKSQSKITSLYEFVLDPTSINKSIESIFYVAFLVHDGWAGLHRPASTDLKDLAIELKPEKRPERTEEEEKSNRSQVSSRRTTRSQYILSFSPRMYKQLCKVSSGQPIIPSNLAELPDEPQ